MLAEFKRCETLDFQKLATEHATEIELQNDATEKTLWISVSESVATSQSWTSVLERITDTQNIRVKLGMDKAVGDLNFLRPRYIVQKAHQVEVELKARASGIKGASLLLFARTVICWVCNLESVKSIEILMWLLRLIALIIVIG